MKKASVLSSLSNAVRTLAMALDRMIDTRCIFTGAGATNLKMREPL